MTISLGISHKGITNSWLRYSRILFSDACMCVSLIVCEYTARLYIRFEIVILLWVIRTIFGDQKKSHMP